jgi:hypothetical protein
MPPDEEQDEPQAVGEGRELLDLNFFPLRERIATHAPRSSEKMRSA